MNIFRNSFVTQFFVLLLMAGIATLAAPMAVQAAVPQLENVEIISPGTQSGNSYYSYARQRLIGDWYATEDPENTYGNDMRNPDGDDPNKALIAAQMQGPYLIEPGFSPVATLGTGEPVKFFKGGDTIYFKMTFNGGVAVRFKPKFRLDFDGKVTDDQLAVYDSTHSANSHSPAGIVVFKYVVQPGDECVGDGINFAQDQKYYRPTASTAQKNPYFSNGDATDQISDDVNPAQIFGIAMAEHGLVNGKILEFYVAHNADGMPQWPPRTTAYIHGGLNHLIDAVPANVRITGLIKPATHEEGGVRKNAVDFTTGDFTATDPDVDVTEHDSVTGAFDVEFLFFNYAVGQARGTGVDDTDVLADTTQGFGADDIVITGLDVNRADWTVSEPDFIGLDHRDPGFPGDAGDPQGRVKHSASFKVYKTRITPPVHYTGDVRITVPAGATMDIAGNPNLLSNTLTVPVVGVATPDSIATQLGVPTEVTLALPSVALPSKGFVVLAHSGASVSNTGLAKRFYSIASLPNLETLFTGNGGTLELVHTDAATAAAKVVGPIITEIMWGTDLSQGDTKSSQWIEIYNAGAAIADLSDYSLKITPYSVATFTAHAKAVDTVGNLGLGKWAVPGQSGRTEAVAASNINPDGIAAVPLISMRRKITFADAKVEKSALKGVNNGTLSGSWEVSTVPALNMGVNRIGSPGIAHVTQITRAAQTPIPYSPVLINEIGNSTRKANKWIELRNVSDAEVNLKKWELNVIVPDDGATTDTNADPDEKNLVSFPDKDYKLGAGEILLIVNTSPRNSPLARGKKFGDANGMTAVGAAQGQGGILSDAMFYDAKGKLNALPDTGKFLLALRKANNKEHTAEELVDITGTYFFEKTSLSTHIWPLKATPVGNGNVIDGTDVEEFRAGKVYKRNDATGGTGEKDWGVVGYTGIGYDRSAAATDANGGTPGFPNGSLMDKASATGFSGGISISEIMVNSSNGRQPQWIELRNSSQTQGINLNGWQLKIENVGDVDSRKNVTISLPDKYYLPPNQTMLIATRNARKSDVLTATRVIVLWDDAQGARKALEVNNARFTMLSTKGFTLYLFEKGQNAQTDESKAVDTVTISEDMLTAAKIGDGSERISLIRNHENDVWQSAMNTAEITKIAADVYYGNATDVGTPGWSPGDALPVSLSSFLPKRTDAGVVIKWTTQSELNNAGFNILRSATKTGEFVVINPAMIQGAGTTGEKHTYSYTDKTAKPNVVYYYQIEDVSFDGHRQRLTGATRLRGHIGAAGKLTTTWGDLKVQD